MNNYKFMSTEEKWAYAKATYELNVYLDNVDIKCVRFNAFKCDTLLIPDIITGIGKGAFQGCSNVSEINIPDSVKVIGDYAFCNCDSLRELQIGCNAKFNKPIVGTYLFNKYSVSKIFRIINKSETKEVDGYRVSDFSLVYDEEENTNHDIKTSDEGYSISLYNDTCILLEVPKEAIQDGYFELNGITLDGKSLGNITIDRCRNLKNKCEACVINADVKCISGTFEMGALKFIRLPDSLDVLTNQAFNGCDKLEFVKMPSKMSYVGNNTFCGCHKLKTVKIPDGITEIYTQAFSVASEGLNNIVIPKSVKIIDRMAFGIDNAKVVIDYLGTIDEWKLIKKDKSWDSFNNDKQTLIKCIDGNYLEKRGDVDV